MDGYVSTLAWARQHPKTAAAFTRAIEQGQTIANHDVSAVRAIMAQNDKLPPQVTASMALPATYPVGPVVAANIQRVAAAMLQFGVLGRRTPTWSRPSVDPLWSRTSYGLHACLEQYLPEPAERRGQAAARAARAWRRGPRPDAMGPGPGDPLRYHHRRPGARRNRRTRGPRPRAARSPASCCSGGQGDLAGTVLQIGHMGPGAYPLSPVIAVTALGRALRALGADADIGAAVEAAVQPWNPGPAAGP